MKRFGRKTLGVLAGVAASGLTAPLAHAQFVAVNNYQQPATTGVVTPAPTAYQAPTSYQAATPYQAPPSYQNYQAPPAYAGATGYQAPQSYSAFPRVAQAGELPAPTESVGSGSRTMTESAPAPIAVTPTPVYSAPAVSHGVPTPAAAPMVSHQAVPHATYSAAPVVSSAGCATGDCGAAPVVSAPVATTVDYQYSPVGQYESVGAPACNLAPVRPRRQWFGGLYGLFLERDNPGKEQVSVFVEDTRTIPNPYYLPSTSNFLFTTDADTDTQFGGEIRFGSTFGGDGCGCHQPFAWEVAYWGLEEDDSQSVQIQSSPIGPTAGNFSRIYGRINYAGLEYDRDGAGGTFAYRPLNEYADYQVPIVNGGLDDIRVTGQRVRQTFTAQNIEINFWRFGTPTTSAGIGGGHLGGGRLGARLSGGAGGYGPGSCGVGGACGGGACGVEGACGGGACSVGGACRPPRRFFINGLAGIRIFRTDESWQNAFQFSAVGAAGGPGAGDPLGGEPTQYTGSFPLDDDNNLFHNIDVDNQLVGFQLGCSMNWLVGCRWNLFADSNFGVYNNNIDVRQRVFSGGSGVVRFVGDGANADVSSSVDRAAFLGDLRLGVGYQLSHRCRVTAAYRIIATSGIALAVEQIPVTFDNAAQLAHIDDNDSLVLQGLQTGVEFKY